MSQYTARRYLAELFAMSAHAAAHNDKTIMAEVSRHTLREAMGKASARLEDLVEKLLSEDAVFDDIAGVVVRNEGATLGQPATRVFFVFPPPKPKPKPNSNSVIFCDDWIDNP